MPNALFYKCLGVVYKICLGGDCSAPEPGRFTQLWHVQFCFILLMFLNEFSVFEVPAFYIFVDFSLVLLIFRDDDFGVEKS